MFCCFGFCLRKSARSAGDFLGFHLCGLIEYACVNILSQIAQMTQREDNIWIERFWRIIKQEYIYLNPTDNVEELRKGINRFIKLYNYQRPHQNLEKLLPSMGYGIVV